MRENVICFVLKSDFGGCKSIVLSLGAREMDWGMYRIITARRCCAWVNMGIGGFVEPGVNTDVPSSARGRVVGDARLFFAGLNGSRGKCASQIANRHRSWQDDDLDQNSVFARTFANSPAFKLWKEQRGRIHPLKQADPGRTMTEPEIYAGILQALGVDTGPANLPNMQAMRRG